MTLLDAMVLVAAAAGLAIMRSFPHRLRMYSITRMPVWKAVIFGALVLTMTLIPLRFRRPRPRLLGRHPGTIACLAVVLSAALMFADNAASWLRLDPNLPSTTVWDNRAMLLVAGLLQPYGHGATVAGAWMALAISGRWRPEGDWIDRTGRALGAFWIASPFIQWLLLVI
jgi:hypothetical protein